MMCAGGGGKLEGPAGCTMLKGERETDTESGKEQGVYEGPCRENVCKAFETINEW